ncbi:MAG: hypothetical protein SFT91_06110 [Rickettsiaceae bacterium]|nr:hypothetical protein [Rickettsiaceae bacterium]
MRLAKFIITATLTFLMALHVDSSYAAECVVLIHGFGRGSFSMGKINTNLIDHGYKTIAVNYPSRDGNIKTIAETHVLPQIVSQSESCDTIHFVGFSMGGIITRYILEYHRPNNLGKVVFIASPHSGTEIVSSFERFDWFRSLIGPAAMDLSISSHFLRTIPDYVDYPAGVISGTFSINPISYLIFYDKECDGTVGLESTKIKGMKDHLILNISHTLMPYNQRVVEETQYFISHGEFRK